MYRNLLVECDGVDVQGINEPVMDGPLVSTGERPGRLHRVFRVAGCFHGGGQWRLKVDKRRKSILRRYSKEKGRIIAYSGQRMLL